MKGIPMKGWEVRAILDNRKMVTRRVVKPQPEYCKMSMAGLIVSLNPIQITDGLIDASNAVVMKPPYRLGDILYVRETWTSLVGSYLYKADQKPNMKNPGKWNPSIHMPREAARIFLRVTDVRVERLQDMSREDAERAA